MRNTILVPRRNHLRNGNYGFFSPTFGHIINEILNVPQDAVQDQPKVYTTPKANVVKKDTNYILSLALPGLSKKDIEINVEKNKLNIKSRVEAEDAETNYRLREFNYAKFERSFTLSEDADTDNISAKFEKGILSITIPTLKEAGPVQIKIK